MSADVVPLPRQPGRARLLLKDDAYSKICALLLQGEADCVYSERARRRARRKRRRSPFPHEAHLDWGRRFTLDPDRRLGAD